MKQAENAGKRTNFVDGFSQWIQNPNKKDLESDEKEGGETGKPQGNGIQQKYRKYRLRKMEKNYMKEENYTSKNGNLTIPGNENKNKMMTTIVEYDGEEDCATSKAQSKKCENLMSNTDTTNDNTCNSCTSASRNIDNGKVTNMETKSVPTNNEGNKGEGSETETETEAEAEAEAEADTKSEDSNIGNTDIGRSDSTSNGVYTKILKPPDKNEDKKIGNNKGFNGINSSKIRELQQQKCENTMSIAIIVNDSSGKSEINISTITTDESSLQMIVENDEYYDSKGVAEAEAEVAAAAAVADENSEDSNNDSNNDSNYNDNDSNNIDSNNNSNNKRIDHKTKTPR